MKSICVFAANGLGDGLLALVLARNLQRLGHQITVYSSPLCSLSSWVPWTQVRPFMNEADMDSELKTFDHIIAAEHSRAVKKGEVIRLDRSKTIVQNFEKYLQDKWGTVKPIGPEDLVIPSDRQCRKHRQRVVLHPMSGAEQKNWPAEKFISLARKLRAEGFEPVFVMSPAEAKTCNWLDRNEFTLPIFSSLTDTASFIYESGYLIGNDSGLGHMASLFRVPTLSLFARDNHARVWRPGWGPGIVVTPTLKLPGARLREKYWKQLLTVGKVLREFKSLVQKHC